MSPEVTNANLVPFAVARLGGGEGYVDVEDVFAELWNIAPARFRWRKYDFPDLKKASKALRDFEGSHPDLLLRTPDGLGRQLSVLGQEWVEHRRQAFDQELGQGTAATPTRRRDHAPLIEMERHPLVRRFFELERLDELDRAEVSELLKVSPDSDASALAARLARFQAASRAANRDQLYRFLTALEQARPEWFEQEE